MTDRAVIAFAPTILERDDLLVLFLLDDFTVNSGTFDQRRAMGKVLAVADHEDIGEDALFADFRVEEINLHDVAFRDAVLSAA